MEEKEKSQENPFLKNKMQRVKNVMNILTSLKEVGYHKAIALIEYNFGVSNRVAKHDIDILIDLGSLEKKGMLLIVKEPCVCVIGYPVWCTVTHDVIGCILNYG